MPPIDRRYNTGPFPGPGGVNTEIGDEDPTAVPPNGFLQLVNVRWAGNALVPRGGQVRVNTDVLQASDARIHPFNFELGAPYRLWMVGLGCPNIDEDTGFYTGHYYPDQCPRLQRATYYATATGSFALGVYGGIPHVTVDGQLRRLQLGSVKWGREMIGMAGGPQDIPLADLPSGYKGVSMAEFDGKLFIGVIDGGGNGLVLSWDGIELATDLDSVGDVTALGLYRDVLVAGFDENYIYLRAKGDTATWTQVTPSSGSVTTFPGNNSIRSFRDVLYGASGSTTIWSYDGSLLTGSAHEITDANIEALATDFGLLVYGYDLDATALLGTYDGSSWVDAVKNLTSQAPSALKVCGLERYQNSIVAGLAPTGVPPQVAISPGSDLDGEYELVSYQGNGQAGVSYLQLV